MISDAHPLAISGFITIAVGLIVLIFGITSAKSKNYNRHKRVMQLAILILVSFLVQYITRAFILGEETHFSGSDEIKYYVFYPILIVHISGAILTLGLLAKHVLKARAQELKTDQNSVYFPKEYREEHKRLGTITYRLWLLSYLGGIIIFVLLYL